MKHADPEQLEKLVTDVVMSSSHAKKFKGVEIQDADFDNEIEYLKVRIHFKNLNKTPDDDIRKIVSSVEGAVAQQDDRFPSIWFSNH